MDLFALVLAELFVERMLSAFAAAARLLCASQRLRAARYVRQVSLMSAAPVSGVLISASRNSRARKRSSTLRLRPIKVDRGAGRNRGFPYPKDLSELIGLKRFRVR